MTLLLTDEMKAYILSTANALHGAAKRRFMALTLKQLGPRSQRLAARELGWGRPTLQKAAHEFRKGHCLRGCLPSARSTTSGSPIPEAHGRHTRHCG